VLAKVKAKLGPRHPATLHSMTNLAGAYFQGRRYADAEPLLLRVADVLKADTPSPEQRQGLLAAVRRVILLYDAWGRPKDAARWRGVLEGLEKAGRQAP
jgi:hypothetical protein